jgi:hypothetical protein
MRKTYFMLSLAVVICFCGCGKQNKINGQKIDLLQQKIVQLEQSQAQQTAELQAQLNSLAPMMDKINGSYFEKNRDDALFFHTNTLYLLVTVAKQIEAQLQTADTERVAQNSLAYSYHTNELTTMYLCAAQIEQEMNDQETRIENNINAEAARLSAAANNALLQQIKLSSAPDADEIARRKELTVEIAQIQSDLNSIKVRLAIANQP